MGIGEKIRKIREEKGLTQQQLADCIGVKRAAISKYENDSVNIPTNAMLKIAEALNVNPIELFADIIKNTEEFLSNSDSIAKIATRKDRKDIEEMQTNSLRNNIILNYNSLNSIGQVAANAIIEALANEKLFKDE